MLSAVSGVAGRAFAHGMEQEEEAAGPLSTWAGRRLAAVVSRLLFRTVPLTDAFPQGKLLLNSHNAVVKGQLALVPCSPTLESFAL